MCAAIFGTGRCSAYYQKGNVNTNLTTNPLIDNGVLPASAMVAQSLEEYQQVFDLTYSFLQEMKPVSNTTWVTKNLRLDSSGTSTIILKNKTATLSENNNIDKTTKISHKMIPNGIFLYS